MDEPSVLDYVKAKLMFWKKSDIQLPEPVSAEKQDEGAAVSPAEEAVPIPGAQVLLVHTKKPGFSLAQIPWLSLLAFLLALAAQKSLEPGTGERTWKVGAVLYALAGLSLLWALLRDEWAASPLRMEEERERSRFKANYGILLVGILLALTAFATFGMDLFTPVNLTLWLLSLAAIFWSLWQHQAVEVSWWEKVKKFFTNPGWNLKITRWTLVLMVAALLIIFFRFYQLDQVPSDMVSDQAEKLLDVNDLLNGQTQIFFPRNTGREAFQFYWTAAIILIFKTGLTFMSLKIGTVLAGLLTLPFIYLLGKEVANRRVGLFALLMAGIAYWPNVISRFGLRFPLYPMFAAPTLYFLVRGLRTRRMNDFLLSGLALGIGLHGYTPIRILPFVVVAVIGIYLLHRQAKGARKEAVIGLILIAVIALAVFLPLVRYALDNPELFNYRTLTRLGSLEKPLDAPAWQIFLHNVWNASTMFFWSDGEVWVHSIPLRPALDVVSAALLFLGVIGLTVRYIRYRHWIDLFLILSIPMLMLPSTLSLAFPNENPSLNRTGGAVIPVFIIIGFALDGFVSSIKSRLPIGWGRGLAVLFTAVVIYASCRSNYDLVFNQYAQNFTNSAWNTAEMGTVMREFIDSVGSPEGAWTVGYPYWVDTRLVGITAGYPTRDTSIWPDNFSETVPVPGAKMFLINPEDKDAVAALQQLYPQGTLKTYHSKVPTKDFLIFLVLSAGETGQ